MDSKKALVFADVWDALEDDAETAANLRLRSELMIAIAEIVESWHATKAAAAAKLGMTSPELAGLLGGHIDLFSVDTLVSIADRAGLAIELRIVPRAA